TNVVLRIAFPIFRRDALHLREKTHCELLRVKLASVNADFLLATLKSSLLVSVRIGRDAFIAGKGCTAGSADSAHCQSRRYKGERQHEIAHLSITHETYGRSIPGQSYRRDGKNCQ